MHPYANEIFDFYKKVAWSVRGPARELRGASEGQLEGSEGQLEG